jgi:tellurite resistance protein TerC
VLSRIFENKSYKFARKVIIGVLGVSVLMVGAAMLVLPGPAVLVVPGGLAILASEFGWARRLLRQLKARLGWKPGGESA